MFRKGINKNLVIQGLVFAAGAGSFNAHLQS